MPTQIIEFKIINNTDKTFILKECKPQSGQWVIRLPNQVLPRTTIEGRIEGRDECECKPAYILTFPSIPGEMQALATFKPRVNTIFQCSGNIGNYTIVSDPQTVNGTTLTCVARIQGA